MTHEEAIAEIKELLKTEIDKLPYHHDSEFNADVYDDMFELDKILTLNKIVSRALEKQIPKKPTDHDRTICPSCNSKAKYGNPYEYFCPHCGQAIDWSDLE